MEKFLDLVVELSTQAGLRLLYAIVVLVGGLKLSKIIVKVISRGKGFAKIDVTVQTFIKSFLSILFRVLVFISVAVILGVPTTSFITLLASAGLAVGMALQGSLSNFAGGIILIVLKPFKVGDYIEVDTVSGTVHNITVFYTTLTTIDNKRVTLPNGALTNASIINYSAEKVRRIDFIFSVSHKSDIDVVKNLLFEQATEHLLVKDEPPIVVGLLKQKENSLDFTLQVWCNTEDYWTVYFDLNESVKKAFDRNHIKLPSARLDVSLKDPE